MSFSEDLDVFSDINDLISEAKLINHEIETLYFPKVFSFRSFEILINKIPLDQRPNISLYSDFLDICFTDFHTLLHKSIENTDFISQISNTIYEMEHLFINYIKPSFDNTISSS